MHTYKVKKNGFWKIYSIEFDTQKKAEDWFNYRYIDISKRKLILFKNSKRVN